MPLGHLGWARTFARARKRWANHPSFHPVPMSSLAAFALARCLAVGVVMHEGDALRPTRRCRLGSVKLAASGCRGFLLASAYRPDLVATLGVLSELMGGARATSCDYRLARGERLLLGEDTPNA